MSRRSSSPKPLSERLVRDIRRATRRHCWAEEKIRIALRRKGIAESLYYSWSKEFLDAGKRRLAGAAERAATTGEVKICVGGPRS